MRVTVTVHVNDVIGSYARVSVSFKDHMSVFVCRSAAAIVCILVVNLYVYVLGISVYFSINSTVIPLSLRCLNIMLYWLDGFNLCTGDIIFQNLFEIETVT